MSYSSENLVFYCVVVCGVELYVLLLRIHGSYFGLNE